MQLTKANRKLIIKQRVSRGYFEDRKLGRAALSVSEKYASASSLFLLFIPLILIPVIFCALSDILTPTSAHAEIITAVGSGGYTLTVSGAGTVSLGLTPTAGGTFAMGLETLNIKTNADGYQAYLSTAETTTSLTHTNNTDTIAATPYSYSDTPNTIGTNSWGFAIPASYKDANNTTIINSNLRVSDFGDVDSGYTAVHESTSLEANTKWASIPEKGSPLLVQSTTTANNTTGIDLGIFYAAKVDTTKAAGIYSGEVLYTILANAPSATEAAISPSATNNLGGNNTFTISLGLNTTYSNNIKNNSIITIGEKPCAITGGGNSASGNLYLTCTDSPQTLTGRYNVEITVSDGTNNYGTYYIGNGVEYKAENTFFTIKYMQDMNQTICNTVDTPTSNITNVTSDDGSNYATNGTNATIVPSTTLIDQRDGQSYTVRKLADGNCWMTENLRIGKEGTITLNDQNSNMTANRTFTLNKAVAPANAGTWTNQQEKNIAIYRNDNEKLDASGTEGAPLNTVLYNWYTATAGARNSSGSSLMAATSGQAADSICPKNWQLPINEGDAGNGKSYSHLVRTYTGNGGNRNGNTSGQTTATVQADLAKLHALPTSFVYSDDYNYSNGRLYSRSLGHWWSSTVDSATNSYYLSLDSYTTPYYLCPQDYLTKGHALALRCVAQ